MSHSCTIPYFPIKSHGFPLFLMVAMLIRPWFSHVSGGSKDDDRPGHHCRGPAPSDGRWALGMSPPGDSAGSGRGVAGELIVIYSDL